MNEYSFNFIKPDASRQDKKLFPIAGIGEGIRLDLIRRMRGDPREPNRMLQRQTLA